MVEEALSEEVIFEQHLNDRKEPVMRKLGGKHCRQREEKAKTEAL